MNDVGPGPFILTINGGSSSLKFALYGATRPLVRLAGGMIDRIGIPESVMIVTDREKRQGEQQSVDAPDHAACAGLLMDWLKKHAALTKVRAIGHRVVHGGMAYSRPAPVTPDMLAELRRISPYDPEHMPSEIALIEAFSRRDPELKQIACFDTAFHHAMPRVA